MVFSTRISIQWTNQPALEPTSTVVMTSHRKGLFVDLRLCNPLSLAPDPAFPLEWAITGYEKELGNDQIKFHHYVDSHEVFARLEADRKGLPAPKSGGTDLGTFSDNGDGDRKEVGEMLNDATGRIEPYVEVWRSLDSLKTTPTTFGQDREGTETEHPLERCYVLQVCSEEWEGMVIRLGNWVQGLLHHKSLAQPLSVIRAWFNGTDWQVVFAYGADSWSLPLDFCGSEGETLLVEGISWVCVEALGTQAT